MVERNIFVRILHPIFVSLIYIFLYLPIVVLVLFSFNKSSIASGWSGFSLKWFKALLQSPEMLEALKVSLIVALTSTFLSVLMGAALVFASRWWKKSFLFNIFNINIILPEIIIAIGLISIFTFFKIPLGYESLIAGHTLIGLGFVVPIILSRFKELDPMLTEASTDLGARPLQTFSKIVLPLLAPAIIVSCFLVFTLSLDDFFISFFCSGVKVQTLSVYIFSLVRQGIDPRVNAISTCLLAVSSICVLVLCSSKIVGQVFGYGK